jgi:phage repressor protein C with HTH and peptisase S24 domain
MTAGELSELIEHSIVDYTITKEDEDLLYQGAREFEGDDDPNWSERYRPAVVVAGRAIPEYDVRAGAGAAGLLDTSDNEDGELTQWRMPEAYVRHEIHAQPSQIAIIRVQGDSMVPTLLPEDRVMVDRGQTQPVSDLVYALWDGDGVVVKRLLRVAEPDGPDPKAEWMLVSDNPNVADRPAPPDTQIIGRVIWRASKL